MRLLALLTIVIFGRTLFYPFLHWDDFLNIVRNARLVHGPWTDFWTTSFFNFYIPLTYSSWTLLCQVKTPCDPVLFHAFNLILHLANCVLVLKIASHYLRWPWQARAVAILFLLHPVQVETVAWISGSRDLLAAFFALLTWWLFLREKTPWLALALLFLASLLAKPAFILLPIGLWILHPDGFRKLSPLGLITLGFAIVTYANHRLEVMKTITPLWSRPLIALDGIGFYFGKIVWPYPLLPDYGRSSEAFLEGLPWFYILIGFVVLALALIFFKKTKWPVVAILFVLPVLGFVPFRFQDVSTVADHYLYLSMLPVAILALGFIPNEIIAFVVMVPLIILTWLQVGRWQDTETLGAYVLKNNPRSFSFHNGLADAEALKGHYPEALEHFRQSLMINPTLRETQLGIPPLMFLMGQVKVAIAGYLALEKSMPLPLEAEENLITMLMQDGQVELAHQRQEKLRARLRQ